MKKYFLYIFIILSISLAFKVNAGVTSNTGFVPGQIWYSKESLVEGDTVNIYTAIWNGGKEPVSVKVEFYDKNVILGSREVVVNSMQLKDVYVPWKITSGDHVMSAKIISSLVNISGKKETVLLEINVTSNDKLFIPVSVKNNLGESVSQTDALKNQINKTTSEINSIVPEEVSDSISSSFTVIDNLRNNTLAQIDSIKDETQKQIDLINIESQKVSQDETNITDIKTEKEIDLSNNVKNNSQKLTDKSSIEDATEKPIAYIKLFLFSILSFIFSNKIIFYGLLIFILFLILRLIYRKIRNK